MAVSIAIDGFNVVLKKNGVTLPHCEITEASFPDEIVEFFEVSHAQSPGQYKEWRPGWKDVQDFTVEMNYTQSDYVALRTLQSARLASTFQLHFSDPNFSYVASTPRFSFTAYVMGLPTNLTPGDRTTMSPTLKITGQTKFVPRA